MWLAVFKTLGTFDVKECGSLEEAESWHRQQVDSWRKSYPYGDFPAKFYHVADVKASDLVGQGMN